MLEVLKAEIDSQFSGVFLEQLAGLIKVRVRFGLYDCDVFHKIPGQTGCSYFPPKSLATGK
jgi:hypothetical protein